MNSHPEIVTVTLNPAIDQTVTIPNFAAGAVNRVSEEHSRPGGKGVNVAANLADHGFTVAATGFLGRENAAPFEELFHYKEILDYFIRVEGRTRIGIKISDPAREQTTDINFPGLAPQPRTLNDLRNAIAQLKEQGEPWFVLGGSLPPGVDPSFYLELGEIIGHKLVLDTSGEPLRLALDACPAVVKPNVHELEELLGRSLKGTAEVLAAGRELLSRVKLVIVSMGGEGALFITEGEAVLARPPQIKVLSTVGAGDAMVAGTVAARLRGLDLAETARLATAFSIVTLQRVESPATAVDAVGPQVQVRPL